MDEYSKKVSIEFEPDSDSLKNTELKFDQLAGKLNSMLQFDNVNRSFDEKAKEFKSIMDEFVTDNGVEAQIALLDYREDVLARINELEELGTKAALEQVDALQLQVDALNEIEAIKEHDAIVSERTAEESRSSAVSSNLQSFKGSAEDLLSTNSLNVGDFMQTLFSFKMGLVAGLVATGAFFLKQLKDILGEGAEKAKELVEANRLSNQQTRETMFKWGTTRAGAYGVQEAQTITSISSQEDLWWASQSEQRAFYDIQAKFAKKYIAMQESGTFERLLEYQIKAAELEEEMSIEEAKFYADNAEYILAWNKFTMSIKKAILDIWVMIAKFFGADVDYDTTEDKASDSKQSDSVSYSTSQTNANKYMRFVIDNSFNNSSPNTRTTVENSLDNLTDAIWASL